jgi:hypothetical protein
MDRIPSRCHVTFQGTLDCINEGNTKIVNTTQTHFCSFKYAERIFIHTGWEKYEITLGKCDGTIREIKTSQNIERQLLNGEFDWYNEHINRL